MGRHTIAGVWLALVLPGGPAAAQAPVRVGSTLRVAEAPVSPGDTWTTGTVLAATRLGVLVRASGASRDTLSFALDGSVRVQLRRRSNIGPILGAGIGAVVGSVLGATAFGSTFGRSWGDPGVVAETVGFGLLGTLLGGGLGFLGRPTRWVDVPVRSGGLAMTPRTREAERTSLNRRDRWSEFDATVEDFSAFFGHWRDSLEAVEGIWENLLASRAGSPPLPQRFAILRDARYAGYDLIGVSLPPRGVSAGSARNYGWVIFALRQADRPGTFELRLTGSRDAGSYQHRLGFSEDALELLSGGEPFSSRWLRVASAVP
ncbi:MAG TPA: hypothetical protein VD793_10630 [Gemmatimonadales bacterium]|nr:hypothetical protein [Gemmatimonadales bacterium]